MWTSQSSPFEDQQAFVSKMGWTFLGSFMRKAWQVAVNRVCHSWASNVLWGSFFSFPKVYFLIQFQKKDVTSFFLVWIRNLDIRELLFLKCKKKK